MLNAPPRLGKYQVLRRIGVGGMAEVFEAELGGSAGFRKRLALKVLLPACQREPELVKGFIDEASIAARLSHPNIVPVFDFGEIDGTYYLAMEYIDGWDLAEVISWCRQRGRPLSPAAAAYLIAELAKALHYIHTHDGGIVHRDISPHNIFITREGHLLLGDFGVAKAMARLSRTTSGQIKGKLGYLAPEQARGEPVSPRTDVYGAGLVLYELLTSRRFNQGAGEVELLARAANPVFQPPSQLTPEARPLDEVVRGALQSHPAMRTRDALLLASQLGEILERVPFGPPELARLLAELRPDGPPAVGLPPLAESGEGRRGAPKDSRGSFDPEQRTLDDEPAPAASLREVKSTETVMLDGEAGPPRRRGPILLALAAGLALAGAGGWLAFRARSTPATSLPVATPPASRPVAVASSQPAASRPIAEQAEAEEPEHPVAHRPRKHQVRPRPRPQPKPAPVVAQPVRKPDPPAPRVDRQALQRRLDGLVAAARGKGAWPGDEAELDRLRKRAAEAIARGSGEPELAQLATAVERFHLDQPFIKRKLRRLEQELARPGRSDEDKRRMQLGTQEVLRLVLAEQLLEASKRITALLGR
jgi:eukaryotic-like serine/threonine-protein kinase